MDVEHAVVIETYSDESFAEAAVSYLEAEGIEAMIVSDDAGHALPNLDFARGVRVMVRSSSGDVTVRGSGGEVEASSMSGDISVVDARERVEVGSISGDVTLRDVRGHVEAGTVSGKKVLIQPNCLKTRNSGIMRTAKGIIIVLSKITKSTLRPGKRSRAKP